MAFPSRFGVPPMSQTPLVPVYGAPMIPIVHSAPYIVPALSGGMITSVNPRGHGRGGMMGDHRNHGRQTAEKPNPTTVFVGNINDKASNELVKTMLARCGNVLQWKRVQGPTGRFQAFGFCEFDHPDSALRAVRLMHEWKLGDKPLTVKVDGKTKESLRDYVNKRRQAQGKEPLKFEGDELPCDDDMQREDASLRKSLQQVMMDLGPDLVEGNEGNVRPRTPELYGKGGNLDIESLDRERKEYIAREISTFRQAYMDDNKRRDKKEEKWTSSKQDIRERAASPSPPPPRPQQQQPMPPAGSGPGPAPAPPPPPKRPDSRSSTATASRVRSPSPQESLTGSQHAAGSGGWTRRGRRGSTPDTRAVGGRTSRNRRSRSRSRLDSDDEEMSFERRRLERKMREKEESYLERLSTWESREKKRGKEYERRRLKEKAQRQEERREAKKLKEFLEDYDDERDDPKYYRGKFYEMRRREYEKERENDEKDGQKEKEEFEEIRQKLLEEGISNPDEEIQKIRKEQDEKLSRRLNAGDSSESPSPFPHPVQERVASRSDEESAGSSPESGHDEDDAEQTHRNRERRQKHRSKENRGGNESAKSQFIPATLGDTSTSVKPIGFTGMKVAVTSNASASTFGATASVESEEDNADKKASSSRRLVPLDYTDEEKAQISTPLSGANDKKGLSAEEKKKIIKTIIEKIPTAKDELYAYEITWSQVDQTLIDRRLKPWVTKKIIEYIGEDEQSLVEFICQKISQKTPPQTIVDDISMVLDEEASVFVVKLWRLLIYEIEAKKLGLVKTDSGS